MKKICIILFLIINYQLLIINSAKAQDSSHLQISLLTCTPGEELYSTFGHSAFRVVDSSMAFNDQSRDVVYNYGTFNFDEDFYLKFIRGKLLYFLSEESFPEFKAFYQLNNRGIIEQVLNLTGAEKLSVRQFLRENRKEENRYYKYDFFLDNCTTRLRDIIKKQHDSSFCKKPVMPVGTSFRQAIHEYLDKNGKYWSELGIDILLGQPCDAGMTAEQMQFLPDNLMKSLDSSNSNHQLVLSETNLYPITEQDKSVFFTPLVVFSLLFIIIAGIGFWKNATTRAFLLGFDGLFFFLTGLLGIIIVFMWTATDHAMCKNNFNLLWAWPTHAVMAFFVNSKKNWVKKYFRFAAIILGLLLLTWFFLPQQMNNGLIPVVLLLIWRSYARCQAQVI